MTAMKAFSLEDQHAFARLSGDANPIHVDPLAARRLQFGEPVVHGVHILLRALDGFWAQAGAPRALAGVQAVFLRPLRLGRAARVETRGQKADGARLVVVGDEGEDLVRITVRWAAGAPTGTGDFGGPAHRAAPAEPAGFADLAGTVGVGCDPVLLARLLPHLAAALPARHLALILATTYLVGMEAPGRHSLFTQLDLTFDPQPGHGDLAWQVRRFDERFSLLTLGLEAGDARGEVRALVRAAPVVQAGMEAIAAHVRPGAFAGQRALVVGGSRGLGEVAAKLLAAGGAQVCLTYRTGADEARAVADQIDRWNGPEAQAVQVARFDAASPPAHDLAHDLATLAQWAPSHLYYFASPFIQTGQPDRFSHDLFARFCAVYVAGFVTLAGALRGSLVGAFAPSSVHVEAPPPTLREYAVAKAAAEFAGAHLLPAGLACTMPRLPVLLTDQTAALADGAMEEACAVLLAALSPSRTGRG
ncbi:MAG TPA: hypothetical protein EYH41_15410 [Novosphingobium capsulatum]|nr:hypothetical protein [Novosphingobium capsulatum]